MSYGLPSSCSLLEGSSIADEAPSRGRLAQGRARKTGPTRSRASSAGPPGPSSSDDAKGQPCVCLSVDGEALTQVAVLNRAPVTVQTPAPAPVVLPHAPVHQIAPTPAPTPVVVLRTPEPLSAPTPAPEPDSPQEKRGSARCEPEVAGVPIRYQTWSSIGEITFEANEADIIGSRNVAAARHNRFPMRPQGTWTRRPPLDTNQAPTPVLAPAPVPGAPPSVPVPHTVPTPAPEPEACGPLAAALADGNSI